jgi:hypothetical protein
MKVEVESAQGKGFPTVAARTWYPIQSAREYLMPGDRSGGACADLRDDRACRERAAGRNGAALILRRSWTLATYMIAGVRRPTTTFPLVSLLIAFQVRLPH